MPRKLLSRIGLLLLLICPAWAFAQTPSGDAVSEVIGMLFTVPATMVANSPFAAVGTRLLAGLLAILVSWRMIKLVLEGSGILQIIGELVNIILLWGIASFFLTSDVTGQIASGFDSLATMATGATAGSTAVAGTSAESQLTNNLVQMLKAAYQLYEGAPPDNQGFWAGLWNSLKTFEFVASLANLLFRFFTAILVVVCALLYCVNLVFSQIMVNIALIVAPIFVPWIMWDASSFLFHGWLKFLITAGVQKIVGALMFGITSSFVGKVATLAGAAEASPVTNFYYYAACFLLAGIMAYMMMQVQSIANGLISGSARAGFQPPRAMTPGGGLSRGVGGANVSKAAGAGAGAAGSKILNAAKSGVRQASQRNSVTSNAINGGANTRAAASSSAPPSLPKAGGNP